MKKFIVLSLAGLLILAFGATGYAQQLYQLPATVVSAPGCNTPQFLPDTLSTEKPPALEFKAAGAIDIISEYNKNVPQAAQAWTQQGDRLFGPNTVFAPKGGMITTGPLAGVQNGAAFNKKQSYMETRGRLRFDAVMGKQVSGTIFFEIDATRWGERTGLGAQRNQAGLWNADTASVEVKNLFITAALPPILPVPVTFQGGIMPLVTRPVLQYTDGTGIQIALKPDPVQIQFQWMKALENEDWAADDADVYNIQVKVNLGKVTVGGFMSYYNMNTYPFQSVGSFGYTSMGNTWPQPYNGVGGANPYGALVLTSGINQAYMSTAIVNQTADFSWWGIFADGKIGPVNICFDAVYDHGKVKAHGEQEEFINAINSKLTGAGVTAAQTVKYDGWITRIALDYPWERFNFGFAGMYASGSDLNKTSSTGYPGSTVAGGLDYGYARRVGGYVFPPLAEVNYDDESIVFYGTGANGINRANTGYNWSTSNGVGRAAYGGTWFAKLYGQFKPTPWYRVTLFGMYIGDTTKHGNTIGDAVEWTPNSQNAILRDDKTIGWEFDIFNDIQIYKNLQFRFGGGILLAGKAFDYYDTRNQSGGVTPAPGFTGSNTSPANPWAITLKLIYVF